MNLRPSRDNPKSRRPTQPGYLLGERAGQIVWQPAEWVVDTGAEITTVRADLGRQCETKAEAWSASPTTGVEEIRVVTGLAVEFEVQRTLWGRRRVKVAGYFGIKPDNGGSELLGMQQLAKAGSALSWNPRARTGKLRAG